MCMNSKPEGKRHWNEGRITYQRNILLRWLFWVWRKVSSAASCSYYWMLVQNNYLLAKNERTLTLQTYWIHAACLQAMSGVIQFCLRRTIYYERWVKKAPSLIAPQNHYQSVEGPWAARGGTRKRWSRLPGDQIQFALWAARHLWAISRGRGRQLHQHRAANCLCLAWKPSPSWGGGSVASSAPGWMFLHWQRDASCPQKENPILKVQYVFTSLMLPLPTVSIVWCWCFPATFLRQSQVTASFKMNILIKPTKKFMWSEKPKQPIHMKPQRIHFCWKINMWSFVTSLPQCQWESFQWVLITSNQATFSPEGPVLTRFYKFLSFERRSAVLHTFAMLQHSC